MIVNLKSLLLILVLVLHVVNMIGYNAFYVIAAISILYVFMNLFKLKKRKYYSKWLIFTIVVVAFTNEIYCCFKYNQSIIDGIVAIYFIFAAFIYYAFYDYFKIDINRIMKIISVIENIAAIVALLAISQAFIFPGVQLFDFTYRNGNIRIYGTALGYFALLFLIGKILIGKITVSEKVKLGILVVMLLFVSQSRGGIITLTFSALWGILIKIWNNGIKKALISTVIFFILTIVVLYIFYKIGYLNFLFTIFDEILGEYGSSATRSAEITYYQELMIQNPFMGIGILKGGSSIANEIYRQDLWFYIEDTGILGFCFQTGIMGIVWICYLLIVLMRKIHKLKLLNNDISQLIRYVSIMILITSIIGFTFTNYIVARSSISLFFMILAMMDSLIYESIFDNNNNVMKKKKEGVK